MPRRLAIRPFLAAGDAYHFARLELGPIQRSGRHTHDFPELFWVESGRGVHWIGGEKRALQPATLVFVLPADLHTLGTAAPEDGLIICNLAFPSRRWPPARTWLKDRFAAWFAAGPAQCREHTVGPGTFAFLRQAGAEMLGSPRSALMLERFFLNLAFALEIPPEPPVPPAPLWLAEALLRVERQGLFREGPQALTRCAGRSQEHVVREVQRWFGKTPTALLNELRMRHAAHLLSATQREITDICLDCGFENLGHFYALFRRTHQLTPRAYRLAHQSIIRPAARRT